MSHLTLEQKIDKKFDEEWGYTGIEEQPETLASINLKNSELYKEIEN